jgi:glycosyltransferase involved in cell wall biosynthesis
VRILVVSQYFWPEEFRINEVTRSLVERGIQVDVLTGKPNYPEGKIYSGYRILDCIHEQYQGAFLSRVPLFPRGNKSKIGLVLNYLSFVLFGLFCGPWLKRRRQYDVIFVYAPSPLLSALPALFLGWLKKSPVVIWIQDLWPQSLLATGYVRNPFVLWLVERMVCFIYRHADLLMVQSQAFVEPVRVLASTTPIIYYPNSVDVGFKFPAAVQTPEVPGLDAAFIVMFAGNIGSAQAVEVIVDAAMRLKEFKDIQFIVLGDGSCREWMQQQVDVHGLGNLHMPGRFPVETMPGFMQKASALLVTLADREIFAATVPNKVQAYMAAGRPIIACLRGEGARLVTEAKAGIGVRAEDGDALAEAILRLYRMPESEREEMGRNGQAYFHEYFNHEKLVDHLIEQLRKLCISSRHSV